MYRFMLLALIPILVSACVFVPRESRTQHYAQKCKMLSRELTLEAEDIHTSGCHSSNDLEVCLLGLVVIPAASFVVSGSIVLVGNTLHWLEYQGSC
jgi:hypothetical protein